MKRNESEGILLLFMAKKKKKLQQVFGTELTVYLDIFHAVKQCNDKRNPLVGCMLFGRSVFEKRIRDQLLRDTLARVELHKGLRECGKYSHVMSISYN